MANLDTLADRRERRAIVADVRAFDPTVRIGDAKLNIMSGRQLHDQRWMEWSHGHVRVEGYYHSAHGAHADGWREWLAQNMTPEQDAAYQDCNRAGWAKNKGKTAATARPVGWYWVYSAYSGWEPARYSEKGWELSFSSSTAYFRDDQIGQIGPQIEQPSNTQVSA